MGRKDWVLTLIVSLFVLHSLILGFFMLYQTHEIITGKATAQVGRVGVCINNLPILDLSNCSRNLTQNTPYYCIVNGTDADNDTIIYSSSFITSRTVFAISPFGVISFTPVNDDVGNHTANITADDSVCPDTTSWSLFSFSVANVNDPPYLNKTIPDQLLIENTQLRSVFLNDHFKDPDNDPLTYTHTLTANFTIIITDGSQLVINPTACPAEEYIIFTAKDPYNLSADSNIVKLNCSLPQTEITEDGIVEGSGGSGGSGGGATRTCIPELFCYDWEACQANGTQRKKCFDENGCNDDIIILYRECEYISQCHNKLRDWNEEGVDCGGPCPPCPTCYDGKKNGLEEDIDCGGTCDPCIHSLVAFGELATTTGYEDDLINKQWRISIADIQKKNITVIDRNLADVPYARFSTNASSLFYLKEHDIWKSAQGISRRITETKDILTFSHPGQAIYYSNENYIENILYPHLIILDITTLEEEDTPLTSPVFFPDAKGTLVAYQTKNYRPDITKRAYLKGFSQFIFGKLILPEYSEIRVVDEAYKDVLKISDSRNNLYTPRFSPDGKIILYVIDDGSQTDIMIASVDGTMKKKLTNTPSYQEIFPLFSRDGTRILFAADYDGKYAIYTTDIAGNETSVLLSGPNPIIPFDWYFSPSCFDGIKNQDEADVDCGGFCGSCGTCTDGMKNQNEIGIDCGGPCKPCEEESPAEVRTQRLLFLFAGFGLLLILLLIFLFHKQLKKIIKKFLDRILHREHREILLDSRHKHNLLKRIFEAEQATIDLKDRTLLYSLIARDFMRTILTLSPEFDDGTAERELKAMRISFDLKKIFGAFLSCLNTVEFGIHPLKEIQILQYLEELRTLVLTVSERSPEDLKVARTTTPLSDDADDDTRIRLIIKDIYIALQFEEILVAKKKYVELHHLYRQIPEHKKHAYYENIHSAYRLITYCSSLA
ncbi:MAG: hypothetical protein ABIJ21_01130 [Nanoarchaeota archaeon]